MGYNGYGFGQSLTKFNCYNSYSTVKKQVMKWFDEKMALMDLATAVCYYNTGHKINNCDYYNNYLTLK